MTKKLLLIVLIVFLFKSVCMATDFRESEWGFSKEQVELSEKTRPLYSQKDALTFRGKIANIQVLIKYEFIENKLKYGTYTFIANYANNNVYLKDYERINDLIDLKYGKPETRKELWNNELYKEKKGYHGNAISIGHLMLESTWIVDKTIIVHKLSGNNNIVDHNIKYYDKKWFDSENKNEKINGIKGL